MFFNKSKHAEETVKEYFQNGYLTLPPGVTRFGLKLVDPDGYIMEGGVQELMFEILEPETLEEAKTCAEQVAFHAAHGPPYVVPENAQLVSVPAAVAAIEQDMLAFLDGESDIALDGSMYKSNRIDWMLMIAQSTRAQTVCETGFNWGVTARTFLELPQVTKVYSFDLMDSGIKYRAQEMLQRKFGNRLEVFAGPTRETLKYFVETHPDVRCDVVLVDGGHFGNDSEIDMLLMHQVATSETIVIADDCSIEGAGELDSSTIVLEMKEQIGAVWLAWNRMRKWGAITHLGSVGLTCLADPDTRDYSKCYPSHHVCFGRYKMLHGDKLTALREYTKELLIAAPRRSSS